MNTSTQVAVANESPVDN